MRAKIDITEVETRTKIRAKYLRAIENEEWDLLPGEIYVKSFLRTYGDYLGLDSRMLVDEFKRRYDRPSDNELRPLTPPRARERERRRGPAAAVGGDRGGAGARPGRALLRRQFDQDEVAHHADGKDRRNAPPRTAPPPRAGVRHAESIDGQASADPDRPGLRLPRGWPRQEADPGQIFSAGQTIPAHSASKLLLTLGNNSVTMRVDGAPVNVASSPSSIGFLLKPGSTTPLPVSKQPRCA